MSKNLSASNGSTSVPLVGDDAAAAQAPTGNKPADAVEYIGQVGRYIVIEFTGQQPVQIDLHALLCIDPERLDEQLADAPARSAYFGNLLANVTEAYYAARRHRRTTEALVYRSILSIAEANGQKKPTEGAVKNEVRSDQSWMEAQAREEAYEVLRDRLERIYWSLRERHETLRALHSRSMAVQVHQAMTGSYGAPYGDDNGKA